MSEKTLKTRIQNKRGTTAEWATGTAPNFVPKDGEIVAYTDVHRIKVGDGTTKVSALPFVDNKIPENLTDGVLPAWDSTSKKFVDSYCQNTTDGLWVEGNVEMGSYEYSLGLDVQNGSFSYSDDNKTTVKMYNLPTIKDSGMLATMYKKYKKLAPFAVGDNLSGKTLLFNTEAAYAQYFGISKTIVTSSGGYTISIASGPPTIRLLKNGTVVQLFADWVLRPDGTTGTVWKMSSYTLPSDFGTISTLNTESGGSTYTSIWNTLGLDGAATEYDFINVEDVYHTIPKIVDNLTTTNASMALSATQGYKLNNEKAPKASPTFTGTVTLSGTTTPLNVSSSVGAAGQVLTSQGAGKSPIWKTATYTAPTNMVTTDTSQSITASKTFDAAVGFGGNISVRNDGEGIQLYGSTSSIATYLTLNEVVTPTTQSFAQVLLPLVDSADANYVDLMSPVHVARATGGTSSSPSVGGLYLPSYAKYKVFTGTNGTCDFGIYKGTSSSNTILFGAGMYNENAPSNAVIINAPLSLGATDDYTGSYGQVLMSNGASSEPSWVQPHRVGAGTFTTAYSSTGGSAGSSSLTWTSTTSANYAYTFIKDTTSASTTAGIYIYYCNFTANMSTADRWYRIQLPSSTSTDSYYGLVVTGRKSTTTGNAPGYIGYFNSSYLYIALDENTSNAGMFFTFCRRVV